MKSALPLPVEKRPMARPCSVAQVLRPLLSRCSPQKWNLHSASEAARRPDPCGFSAMERCQSQVPEGLLPLPSTPKVFQQLAREDSRRWSEAVPTSGCKANEP